jgi:hypothetical protein
MEQAFLKLSGKKCLYPILLPNHQAPFWAFNSQKYVEMVQMARIWFESRPQQGTTFFVEFPLSCTVEKPGEPF